MLFFKSCFKSCVTLFLLALLLAACNSSNDVGNTPSAGEQSTVTTLNAGEDIQASEQARVTLTATVNNLGQSAVAAYAWFPVQETTVFFGAAGRSDESVLQLQLPQVERDTHVEFLVQAQLADGSMLEDRVGVTILDRINNALPVVRVNAMAVGAENRLRADACASTDADGTIATYAWRNETLGLDYPEVSCRLDVALPASPVEQSYTLRAIATDNREGLGFALLSVTAPGRSSNTLPVIQGAQALPEPVRPGETLTLSVNATDADSDTLFYRWTRSEGPVLPIQNADQMQATVQVPDRFSDQTLRFTIEVSDQPLFPADQTATRSVNAAIRNTTVAQAGLLDCLQNPARHGCPLAGLVAAPPLGNSPSDSTPGSAGQCTPFYGGGFTGQGYRHLLGAMHEHTAYSDGQANTDPLQVYEQTRDRGMDFVMSSDHSDNLAIPLALPDTDNCTSNPLSCLVSDPDNLSNSLTKWRSTLAQASLVNRQSPGQFTAMRGFEWTSDRFGHANVYLSQHNINAKLGPGYVVSMDLFWQWFVLSPRLGGGGDGLMVFNHPGREDAIHSVLLQIGEGLGQATRMAGALSALNALQQGDPAYAFNDFKYVAPADYRVVGLEVFGKGDEYDTDGKFGSWYGHALDKGWYLGPVGSEDHHATDWGGSSLPKTVVIARANNQADIREAFLARRFYTVAQQENALRMHFDALVEGNRMPMGSRIGTRKGTIELDVGVQTTSATDTLEGMSFELFSSQSGPASNKLSQYQALHVKSGRQARFVVEPAEGKNWYFVRVKRGERIVAVSAPIWIFKGRDPLPECPL